MTVRPSQWGGDQSLNWWITVNIEHFQVEQRMDFSQDWEAGKLADGSETLLEDSGQVNSLPFNHCRICANSEFGVCEYTRVYSGTGCVYSVRGVRQISWCVTAAIKVVALDTAHEQHNDCRLMLISLRLASP